MSVLTDYTIKQNSSIFCVVVSYRLTLAYSQNLQLVVRESIE